MKVKKLGSLFAAICSYGIWSHLANGVSQPGLHSLTYSYWHFVLVTYSSRLGFGRKESRWCALGVILSFLDTALGPETVARSSKSMAARDFCLAFLTDACILLQRSNCSERRSASRNLGWFTRGLSSCLSFKARELGREFTDTWSTFVI